MEHFYIKRDGNVIPKGKRTYKKKNAQKHITAVFVKKNWLLESKLQNTRNVWFRFSST